eukprot:TRINITY_DN7628_c0_g1_i1.p1 TRINITY_DN7628_c0_g1~~TRINITY_DN7628_c0_g1_i1.p1  ORF type:complete len:657 (-),score=130.99 TRINITY_DN7628_c0_g1_i1:130-2100(-)
MFCSRMSAWLVGVSLLLRGVLTMQDGCAQGELSSQCEDAESVLLQRPRNYDVAQDEEREMLDIIRSSFAGVDGGGSYLEENRHVDESWRKCGMVDWSVGRELAKASAAAMKNRKDLGLDDFCTEGTENEWDDTCHALRGVVLAMKRLAHRFPQGPKFHNAFVVDYGKYNSWRDGSVGEVNWTARPPAAAVLDASGILGYATCSIIRTVMTQSPRQYGAGVCSYMAPLAVIMEKAPAKALEMAVRLLWTGKLTPQLPAPCDYVYDRQPGLVPFKDNGSWTPAAAADVYSSETVGCTGNAVDCSKAGGAPPQPVGLAYMWEAAAVSIGEVAHGASCQGRRINGLTYPGLSSDQLARNTNDQSGTPASMLYFCNELIDPRGKSCKLHFNNQACGGMPIPLCREFMSAFMPVQYMDKIREFWGPIPDEVTYKMLNAAPGHLSGDDLEQALQSLEPGYLTGWDEVWKDMSLESRQAAEKILTKMGRSVGGWPLLAGLASFVIAPLSKIDIAANMPSATPENLQAACRARVALLHVDSTPLNGLDMAKIIGAPYTGEKPFYGLTSGVDAETKKQMQTVLGGLPSLSNMLEPHGSCNHAVYLSRCDEANDQYYMWSWGSLYNVTKAMLLGTPAEGHAAANTGMICAVITADKLTWADADLEAL